MLRLIGLLLVLATLAGGVLYFQSDVFRTKANQTIDEWTKWTPENITRDPKGYLTFALTELEKIEKQLKAHKLELTVNLDRTENLLKETNRRVEASTAVLVRLKDLYRAGERTFPVSYEARNYTEPQFQDLVVETDLRLETARENVELQQKRITHLKSELSRTESEMKKLVEQRLFVQQQLERVSLDTAVGASNDLTAKAEEIAATAKALRGENSKAASDAALLISTEEKKLQNQSVQDRFAQIMGLK